MRWLGLLALIALAGCASPPISPAYVSCVQENGTEVRTATTAEWLFLHGVWNGYEYRGDARAFPIATYTPRRGDICEVRESRS